jgi:TetR/AcrR family transcriptional regulator, copper-responsive repressor
MGGRDLAEATGMNRPSIYAAFGNKRALYLNALKTYWEGGYAAMRDALAYDSRCRTARPRQLF